MKMKKIFSLIFIVLLFFPLFIFADGVTIRPFPEGTWDWVDQNSQEAFISYQNGTEKLIIGIDLQKEFSEAFWIIPIPSKPEDVKIDIVSSLPRFYGWEVTKKTKWTLRESFPFLIYPTVFPGIILVLSGAGAGKGIEGSDVAIVTHLEKAGMVAEVLTAKTDQALYDYLSEKGLKIERGAISIFNQYIGKDYSFVVSWISSEKLEELTGGERGIYITFPTSKIYYPLIPTSAYGKKEIPITIRILGYVKPEIYSEIKGYLKTEYYTKLERNFGDASFARCRSDLHELSILLEVYRLSFGAYPISLDELIKKAGKGTEAILEHMKKYCPSAPLYQVSANRDNYTLSMLLGEGREYFISPRGSGERDVPSPQELRDFYGDKEVWKGNSQYTKITINAPSEKFAKDLWIKPGTPLRVLLTFRIADFATKYPMQTALFLVALLSFLVGGIAGKICFGKFKKYALVGLSNLLTIIGLIIVTALLKKEENPKFSKPAFIGLFFVIYFISSIFLFPIFLYFLLALFL